MIPTESAVASLLKEFGFSRKGRTWWRTTTATIQVINLQRGFGEQLHINLGAYFRALGEEAFPLEHSCHVRARLERVCPCEFFEAIRLLQAPSIPTPEALEALSTHAIRWLDFLSTEQGLCEYLASPEAKNVFVHRLARDLCDAKSAA